MKTMLERLFGHLHRAVFDTSADEIVAFMLDGPAGCRWVAANELFTVTFADGSEKVFDLNNFMIYQFADALQQAGMTVTQPDSSCSFFSGITMLELEGEAGEPQPITLYKDILHAIFGAYSREMRIARDNVKAAIEQMEINTATEGFLNEWGNLFSTIRTEGMDDAAYRAKIKRVAFRKRINSYAIEQVVKEDTGYNITLEEPWREIFRLDISQLSGTHQFYKGDQTGYFLVQPVAYNAVDWDAILPIIKRNLAAGVQILKPAIRGMFVVEDPLVGSVWYQAWSMMSEWVKAESMPKLDNQIVLSGKYEIQFNYEVSIDSNYAMEYVTPVSGLTRRDSSNILAADVIWGNVPISTWFTANKLGDWLQLYPVEPRTWLNGKWDEFATWHMPYSWGVWSRQTANESAFLVADVTEDADGNVINVESWLRPVITSTTEQGWGWEDPKEWESQRWDRGSETIYYIMVAPSNPADKTDFVTTVTSHISEVTLTRELKDGPIRLVATRYDESTDQAVSGGMKQSLGINTDDNIVGVNQETNGYAYVVTPKALGTSTLTIYEPNYPTIKCIVTIKIIERIPWTDATKPAKLPWTALEPAPVVPWKPLVPADAPVKPATSVTIQPLTDADILAGLHHGMQPFTTVPADANNYTMKWEVVDSLGMPYPYALSWIILNQSTGEWVMQAIPTSTNNSQLKLTLTNKDGTTVSSLAKFPGMMYFLTATHGTTNVSFSSSVGTTMNLELNWQPAGVYLTDGVDVSFELTDVAGKSVIDAGVQVTFDKDYTFAGQKKGGRLILVFPKGIPPGSYRGWIWPTYGSLMGGKYAFNITIR
ncbi:hypothetical protein PN823_004561 [Enterobacter hormaechei]|nr:hypothetical protein [Enterobacter hormaechei]